MYLEVFRGFYKDMQEVTVRYRLKKRDNTTSYYELVCTCKNCGIEFTEGVTVNTLYCTACKEEVRRAQTRARVQKYRQRKATATS